MDGGISSAFGKQSLDDWLAQVLSSIRPIGHYDSRMFLPSDNASIATEKCVLAIYFLPSSTIPHQSTDHRYYIRAGAHTLPAPHDIVDALYAKRHFRNPRLVHLARLKYYTSKTSFLHIEIIAATDAVALDVAIELSRKSSEELHLTFPIMVPIIDRDHSFGFRFQVLRKPPFTCDLVIGYRDVKNHAYSYTAQIDASKCVPAGNLDLGAVGQIADRLGEIKHAIEHQDLGSRAR